MSHILIVEDEQSIADNLLYVLEAEGHSCQWFSLAGEALRYQKETPADLIILDVGLPDINGFEACRQLRRFSEVPVMYLTARDAEIDRVVGLEIGADDYVVKPFSPREVSARVRAILKRTGTAKPAADTPSAFRVDEEAVRIYCQGQPLTLTPHEYNLLRCLLAQPGRVFSREQLLDAMGVPADVGYERNIDSHIKSLRAKIRQIDAQGEPIRTQRGFGYSYDPGQQSA